MRMEEAKWLEKRLDELFRMENEILISKAMQRMQTEGAPVYSQNYYRKMAELKQQGKRKERAYLYFGARAVSKVAVLVVIVWIAALSGATAYAVNRYSTPAISMRKEGMMLTYRLEPEVVESLPKDIETAYLPVWLPEGYEQTQYTKLPKVHYSCYGTEGERDEILLMQSTLVDVVHAYDTEDVSVQDTEVSGYPAYYFEKRGFATLLWSDGEYHFELIVPERVKDDIYKIAESLNPV